MTRERSSTRYSNYAVRALTHITISAFVQCSSFGALTMSTDVVVATAAALLPLFLAALVRVVDNEGGTPPTSDAEPVVWFDFAW